MARIINCECGYVARGDDDDTVIDDLEAHIARDHPEMVGKYERQDLLDMVEET
jgi:predicted small metal-binding protein